MKNFLRAVRGAWPYRGRLLISIICAVFAAVLWSLNFTAIYPVLKILGNDQNLHEWIDEEVRKTNKDMQGWQTQVDGFLKTSKELEKLPSSGRLEHQKRDLARDLAKVQSKLDSASTAFLAPAHRP